MQQLSRPSTLRHAAVAASITTLACVPRLVRWQERSETLAFLLAMAGFTSFMLWAFVIAWSPQAGLSWWRWPKDRQAWSITAIAGVLVAILLHTFVDPTLRQITPQDYPATGAAWLAATSFNLAFVQLFVCFAPFAFFYRLLHNPDAAAIGTLALGMLLLNLQLRALPTDPGTLFTMGLLTIRLLSGLLALYLLMRGGPWLVWTSTLLAQLRLLPSALGLFN